jgi:hypothetical protein
MEKRGMPLPDPNRSEAGLAAGSGKVHPAFPTTATEVPLFPASMRTVGSISMPLHTQDVACQQHTKIYFGRQDFSPLKSLLTNIKS